ncbi:MAG: hypothetical protein ACREOF_19170 [Gemmatimonadales bacterium]
MPRTLLVHLALAGLAMAGAMPLPAQQPNRQRDVITREEIEPLQVEDAYQVVLRLRPEFLRRPTGARATTLSVMAQDAGDAGAGRGGASVVTRVTRSPQPPDPNAPEFNREGTSGRSTSRAGGAGGDATPAGGSDLGVGVMGGPVLTQETSLAVYVGSVLFGGVEELTRLPARDVKEIRYLKPSEAQFRFGPRHGAGVIVVTLE